MPAWTAPVLTAIVTVVVYGLTTNPEVGFHDSAELALRASQPGASHAPGAPVHTLAGYLLTRLFDSPVVATSLLSCLSGSLAAAMACLLLLALGTGRAVAVSGALAFAFSFPVWGNAIVTETYSLSLFFLGGCLLVALRWRESGNNKTLVILAGLYGLALGAHFANILLFPAFLYFVIAGRPEVFRNSSLFLGAMFVAVCLIAGANVALAMNVPSFGQTNPDSITGLFLYMSGAEHDPLDVTGAGFYLDRITQHALIFSRHYLFVLIPAGLAGGYILARRDRVNGMFMALVFVLYMGYFTLFGAGDYYIMVSPAYLVFSLWVALAVDTLIRQNSKEFGKYAGLAVLPLAAILVVISQFPDRYAEARSSEVREFAEESLKMFPADSVVVAKWGEFTVLNYYQQVNGRRPDIRIILPVRNSRQYPHGVVEDYLSFVAARVCEQPVVTNKVSEGLDDIFEIQRLAPTSDWYRVIPGTDGGNCAAARP
ncbi:MAG: DUF2723 domain-containing protein [Gammaproteobacteria bacterium]|nr:DUF2723 domain-containing protein [Gammaproteobacteria bacterium]MDP6617597.1 DUF2723 domain-containing protein [Gammaproteobacteria bacterium]MDP6694474.1 DUF2723 domain-containing protein [Gammaproteobacteria bacterium]